MKTFKQTYVIVKLNDNTYDFFKEDYISFDKKELEKICKGFNDEYHREMLKWNPKVEPFILYQVMSLNDALDAFRAEIDHGHQT